ncbi:MAG: RNA polymerase sigma factor [Porcipelethomonas sp.]
MTDLITRARDGDAEAFITLIEDRESDMYKIAVSILHNDADAADAISETVLKCWREIGRLRKTKYFKTWLTRILINSCNDIVRKNKRVIYVDSYESIEPADESEINSEEISECLDRLSENYRLIMLLYYAQGFKVREIAQMLNLNENTVKTRLSRARKQFREIYTEEIAL